MKGPIPFPILALCVPRLNFPELAPPSKPCRAVTHRACRTRPLAASPSHAPTHLTCLTKPRRASPRPEVPLCASPRLPCPAVNTMRCRTKPLRACPALPCRACPDLTAPNLPSPMRSASAFPPWLSRDSRQRSNDPLRSSDSVQLLPHVHE